MQTEAFFLSKAKVLLLDDDPMILMALAEFLQLEGIHRACGRT